METPTEELESNDAQESTLKFDAEKFTDVFKVVTILALMIGGWGLLNYCVKNGIPFPTDIPALLISVGVVGVGLSLIITGIIFFPRLGQEGYLGEEYLWLFPKDINLNGRFIGYIAIPVFLFQVVFMIDVAHDKSSEQLLVWVWYAVGFGASLFSIFCTAWHAGEEGKRVLLMGLASVLAFVVCMWSLLVLWTLIILLSRSGLEASGWGAWAVLMLLSVITVGAIYKMMVPKNSNSTKTVKMIMLVIFAFPIIHPDMSGFMALNSLKVLKSGGGYETSYALRKEYCEGAYAGLCIDEGNKTVKLKNMLDVGDRIYVRIEGDSGLYVIPMRAIIEQKI